MRFKKWPKSEYHITSRKIAAAKRKQLAQQQAFPLFAAHIAAAQPSIDWLMQERVVRSRDQEKRSRADRAKKWRQARQRLGAYPASDRRAILAYWNACVWTGDPSYLCSLMTMFDRGDIDLTVQIRSLYVGTPWTPAVGMLSYEQGIQAFCVTDRLSAIGRGQWSRPNESQ
jgi:hypothetical protein